MVDGEFTLRANSSFKGGGWYDYTMMDFSHVNSDLDGISMEDDFTCVCKVLGFFKYHKAGTPTPFLVDECAHRPTTIEDDGLSDPNIYAAIHASEDWMSYEALKNDFIHPFNLGDPSETLYLVRVDHLQSPMIVFPDSGGPLRRHHAVLPRRHWPGFFSSFIDSVTPEN